MTKKQPSSKMLKRQMMRVAMGFALRDVLHDFRIILCMSLALAAVLAPLLVLFGIKYGIISTMREELKTSPQVREVKPFGQGFYTPQWLDELAHQPNVAFSIPTTRFLSTSIILRPMDGGDPVEVELIPTAEGDPLLTAGQVAPPTGDLQIVLSQRAAEKLDVKQGPITATIGRTIDENPEAIRPTLSVVGVLPVQSFEREAAFIRLPLLLAVEDYREGFESALLGTTGKQHTSAERTYASFRLYARDIDDVISLRDQLSALHIDTQTHLADILLIQRMDNGLTSIFLVIAILGGAGYLTSLTVSLFSAMERKTQQFGLLRLVGFESGAIALFPVVHAIITGIFGVIVAFGLYLAIEPIINTLFQTRLGFQQVACTLTAVHFLSAAGGTILAATLASFAAALRAVKIAPGVGLRTQ